MNVPLISAEPEIALLDDGRGLHDAVKHDRQLALRGAAAPGIRSWSRSARSGLDHWLWPLLVKSTLTIHWPVLVPLQPVWMVACAPLTAVPFRLAGAQDVLLRERAVTRHQPVRRRAPCWHGVADVVASSRSGCAICAVMQAGGLVRRGAAGRARRRWRDGSARRWLPRWLTALGEPRGGRCGWRSADGGRGRTCGRGPTRLKAPQPAATGGSRRRGSGWGRGARPRSSGWPSRWSACSSENGMRNSSWAVCPTSSTTCRAALARHRDLDVVAGLDDVGLGDTQAVHPLADDVDGLVDGARWVTFPWRRRSAAAGFSVTLVPPCRSSPSLGVVCPLMNIVE